MRSGLALILCVFSLLAGCGGDPEKAPPPISANPPPPPPLPPPPPPVIGAAGGTSSDTSGASVIVPAGALTTDTTIRVAMDSTGAPALPAGLTSAGNTYVITPHGGDFAVPIEVSIPAPAVTLLPTQELKLAKAQPGGEWTILDDTELVDGKLKTKVTSFSFFMSVIVTYTLPIFQFEPYAVTATLTCGAQDCANALGPVEATYTVVGNNGQLPANCTDGQLLHSEYDGRSFTPAEAKPLTGYTISKTVASAQIQYTFTGHLRCPNNSAIGGSPNSRAIRWPTPPFYPNLSIVRIPTQLDVVEGSPAQLDVLISGGAVKYVLNPDTPTASTPTATDRAIVDWQRSDDGGASWRVIAHSFQNEANPQPFGTGLTWRPWSVRHGFIATSMDQGALIRVQACYTPPAGTAAPPCVTSSATLLNVLQQSGLPTIATAPRSVLVRTGQTANLSAVVSGLPAPTLQWQTRPANSNGAWTNVSTGTGATTANYTTAATAPSDNGAQYRMVATNAAGSATTTVVTVSVSDLDVAPSITTQPAGLSVASGSDAVFAVDARGTEALSYQWFRNGSALAGENSPVLRLSGVSIMNSGSFTVSVSNAAGGASSNAAVLNVYPGAPAAVAPTIVTQPAHLTVNEGNTATFAVGVDGSGPFTFQWRRNGFNIAGATKAVLSLPSVVPDASGTYSVVVNNSVGPAVTSADASLSVSPGGSATAPEIATQPSTIIVAPGGSAVLAVAASGSGPLYYQWARDSVPISGAEEAVLTLPNVGENDEADYSVTVTNSLGSAVSQSASVILLGAPFVTQPPVSRTVVDGDTTQFTVTAGGSHLRYQWLRNGLAIPGATLSYYDSPAVYVADSGAVYSVIVSNGAGIEVSTPAVLTVIAFVAPSVVAHPANTSVVAGTAAPMCATFGGSPPFEVQMTRWSGTAWLPVLAARRIEDNQPACTVTPVLQLSDNGAQFRFEAIAGPGQAYSTTTNSATIAVTAPSGITTTTLASRSTSGVTANNRSGEPSLSTDGSLVAFLSDGTNLVPNFNGDAFTSQYAYVRNLSTGVTTLINQKPDGSRSSLGVIGLKLAAGGRYAIFTSLAGDLVADDTNGSQDVFVRDLQTGTTRRVSLRIDGTETPPAGNGQSDMHVDISADGQFISFMSSNDLIDNGPPGDFTLYFRNLQGGFLERVASTNAAGTVGHSALSDSGEFLVYLYATFAPGNTRNTVVRFDAEATAYSEVFSIDSTNFASYVAEGMDISGDGRYITFPVRSPTMFNGSTFTQVVALDRTNPGVITVASGDSNGFGNGHSLYPRVSDDGHVIFMSYAGSLTSDFANSQTVALVVRDLQTTELTVASRRPNGTNVAILNGYTYYAISGDGTAVTFAVDEFDMSGGTNGPQVYVAPRP